MNSLSSILWSYFEDDLASSSPVYFTFHKSLIEDLITDSRPEMTRAEALEYFLSTARNLCDISASKAKIKDNAFSNTGKNRSDIIILIALQVVAVEETIRKENDFTDAAYFPKLRFLLSNDMELLPENPFSQLQFDLMWTKFKDEVANSSPNMPYITFDIEKTGAFKNKSKPLSQALLSHSDLLLLANKYYSNYPQYISDPSIINSCISNNIGLLSNRGKTCCRSKKLREHVVLQLNHFLSHVTKDECNKIEIRPKQLLQEVVAKLSENYNFFSNESTMSISFESNESAITFDKGVTSLNQFLADKKFLLTTSFLTLLKATTGVSSPVLAKDAFIIALSSDFITYIEEALGIKNLMHIQYCEIADTPFKLFQLTDSRLINQYLQQTKGIVKKEIRERGYELIGGIAIPGNGNAYLKGYEFQEIIIAGEKVKDVEQVELNDIKMTFQRMMEIIRLENSNYYRIYVRGFKINLSILESIEDGIVYGFKIKNNHLDFTKVAVTNETSALVGFEFYNLLPTVQINRFDFIQLFQKENTLMELNDEQYEVLSLSVKRSKLLSKIHKEYLERFLRLKRKAPPSLLVKFNSVI